MTLALYDKVNLKENLVFGFVFALFLTSSWDVFGFIKVYGYTLRICSAFCVVLMVVSLHGIIKKGEVFIPSGFYYLITCCVLNLLLISKNGVQQHELAHGLWFLFVTLLYLFLPNLVRPKASEILIALYFASITIMSILGIFQLLYYILFGGDFYIRQWIVFESFPRVSGLSYEPSYYAGYLLSGWALCFCIVIQRINFSKLIWFVYFVTSCALITSSSKSALVIMAVFCLILGILSVLTRVFNLKKFSIAVFILLLCGFFYWSLFIIVGNRFEHKNEVTSQPKTYNQFFQGTGLLGTKSHSIDERLKAASEVLEVAKNNFLIGVSFGGIPYEIAKMRGVEVNNYEDFKSAQGDVVFIQVLAATGIFGLLLILSFFYKLSRNVASEKKFLQYTKPLVAGLLVSVFALQINENFFRFYFWAYVALVACLETRSQSSLIKLRDIKKNALL